MLCTSPNLEISKPITLPSNPIYTTVLHLRELEIDRAQLMFDDDGDNEDDVDLMLLQVAERLEGAPGCAQFPKAFRDLHSQVQSQLPSSLFPFGAF